MKYQIKVKEAIEKVIYTYHHIDFYQIEFSEEY